MMSGGKVDVTKTDALLDKAAGTEESLAEAQTRKERALADLREIERSERLGILVEASAVKRVVFTAVRTVRDGILALPDRLAGQLAAETDQHRIRTMLVAELTVKLQELSDAIAK